MQFLPRRSGYYSWNFQVIPLLTQRYQFLPDFQHRHGIAPLLR